MEDGARCQFKSHCIKRQEKPFNLLVTKICYLLNCAIKNENENENANEARRTNNDDRRRRLYVDCRKEYIHIKTRNRTRNWIWIWISNLEELLWRGTWNLDPF